jgi:hypothetical protein
MTPESEITDQASAIRWLIENRRPDISLPEAILRMRRALRGDQSAQATLDALEQDFTVA